MNSGFPSPAQYYRHRGLDLNTYLIQHPESTFFLRVKSSSYESFQIFSGDLLLIDRSCSPHKNDLVLAVVRGQRCLMRYSDFSPSNQEDALEIWGTITYVIHVLRDL